MGSSSILSSASLHTVRPVFSSSGWPATSSSGNSCPASPEMPPCRRYRFGHVYSTMAQFGNSPPLPHASLGEVQPETSSDHTNPGELSSAVELRVLPVTELSILPMEVQPHMSDPAEPQAQCHTNLLHKSPSPSPPSAPVPSSVAPPPRTPTISPGASPAKSGSEPDSHITLPRLCSAPLQTPPSAMFPRDCASSPLSPASCYINQLSRSSPAPSHPLDVKSCSSPVMGWTSDCDTSSSSRVIISDVVPFIISHHQYSIT